MVEELTITACQLNFYGISWLNLSSLSITHNLTLKNKISGTKKYRAYSHYTKRKIYVMCLPTTQ